MSVRLDQKVLRILAVVGVAVVAGPHERALAVSPINPTAIAVEKMTTEVRWRHNLTGCILAFGSAVGHIITGRIGDQVPAISSLGTFLTDGL
jgi:hypothetical protein